MGAPFEEPVDRRAFLAAAGASGLALAGCADAITAAKAAKARVSGSPIPRTFQQAMRGHVFQPGSPGFLQVAHVYNERFDSVLPSAVGRPLDVADVRGAVRWAVGHNVALRPRSGGHSYAGYSTLSHGAVLDLRNMRSISVNRGAGTATIGAGAQLIDVYAALAKKGATIPAGSCPSVGIGGHVLGGGMGLAGRAFGLASDNIVAAQIVTADGHIREVNKHTDPDLLWALRGGGGGNFGVVTQLTMRVHRMPSSAAYFFVRWPWSSASEAIAAWQSWAPHARDQLTSIFHLNGGGGTTSVNISGQYFGPASDLGGLLAPLKAVPGATVTTGQRGYLALQLLWAGCATISLAACHTVGTSPGGTFPRESFNAKSDYVTRPLSGAGRAALIQAIERRARLSGSGAILFDSYGGAINRVAPSATAFVHRNALFCIQYLTYNGGSSWLGQTWTALRPYVSGQAYQNYIDASLKGWQRAYYGQNYSRLLATRRRVDRNHQFNFPQAIGR